jgi:translation elongation factor EF-G
MIISGQIRDKQTNEVLPGVTIALKNTQYGTQSNANGEFTIKNIPSGNYTLIVRLLSYTPIEQNLPLFQDLEFTIGMQPTAYEFSPVEVVAIKPKNKNKWILPASIIGLIFLISKMK